MIRKSLRAVLLIAAMSMPAAGAHAAGAVDELPNGPKVGASVPQTIKVLDQTSQYQDFMALARSRGLIVLFSRSLSW